MEDGEKSVKERFREFWNSLNDKEQKTLSNQLLLCYNKVIERRLDNFWNKTKKE